MQIIGLLLTLVGFAMVVIGGLWLLVVTFQEDVFWGLGSMLIPFVAIIFVATHWEIAKRPFLLNIAGIIPLVLGAILSGSSGAGA